MRRPSPCTWSLPGPTATTRPCSSPPWTSWTNSVRCHQTGTAHLDRAYDSAKTRTLLDTRGLLAEIARKGIAAPVQAGLRWVVERTNSWLNDFGNLRRCTERDGKVVDFYLFLAAAFVTARMLIHRARKLYRWPGRPTTRRLK